VDSSFPHQSRGAGGGGGGSRTALAWVQQWQKEDTFKSPATARSGYLRGRTAVLYASDAAHGSPNAFGDPKSISSASASTATTNSSAVRWTSGSQGLVLEVFGGGRVNPTLLPAIEGALAAGTRVAATTRAVSGNMWDMYGYEGAFRDLQRRGVLFAHDLPGHKARLKLLVRWAIGCRRPDG